MPDVKRWGIGLVLVLLACVPIFLQRHTGAYLLEDTDTAVLLDVIRKEHAPLSWFSQDWPLRNHFYRPVSTLAFEADNALYGANPAGYGLTNALLCISCVLLLFWFCREFVDKVVPATAAAVLFALWHYRGNVLIAEYVTYASWAFLALVLLPKRRFWPPILASLAFYHIGQELGGIKDLSHKVYDWIPGRTATVMTVFALLAMAAYARYERTSAQRVPREPTPLDPPATKSTAVATKPRGAVWLAVAATICCALALGSYEQAVMLPTALLIVAVAQRTMGIRVRWGWHVGFWAALVGYMMLRSSILGWSTSGYQDQQLRDTAGAILSLTDYVLPVGGHLWHFLPSFNSFYLFLMPQAQFITFMLATQISAAVVGARRWKVVLPAYLLSIFTFLPMAWLNISDFNHYHYWPMAMRAVFVATLLWAALEYAATAASPRALQAPRRLDPAPGSLPRP